MTGDYCEFGIFDAIFQYLVPRDPKDDSGNKDGDGDFPSAPVRRPSPKTPPCGFITKEVFADEKSACQEKTMSTRHTTERTQIEGGENHIRETTVIETSSETRTITEEYDTNTAWLIPALDTRDNYSRTETRESK